jgi:hypothetical protein
MRGFTNIGVPVFEIQHLRCSVVMVFASKQLETTAVPVWKDGEIWRT